MIIRFRHRQFCHKVICWSLVVLMTTTQTTWVLGSQPKETLTAAQDSTAKDPQGEKLDLTYCTDRACAALFLYPRQVLTHPSLEMLPIEIATAAGLKEIGVDPLEIEEIQAFVEPPVAGPPSFAVVIKFVKPFRIENLKPQVVAHTQPAKLKGKPYLKSQSPMLPSLLLVNPQTLLVASDEMLQRIAEGRAKDASGPLLDQLKTAHSNDAYLLVNLELIRPLVNAGLQVARLSGEIPPPLVPYLDAPQLIRSVEASVGVTSNASAKIVVHANDEDAAKQLEDMIDDGLNLARQQMLSQFRQQMASEDPIERATAQYMKRVSGLMTEVYRPNRTGTKISFGGDAGNEDQGLYNVATIGILIGLLLPAVQAAREAARRSQCSNNLRQLILSFHNYHDTYGHLPTQANYDKDGKALLSWRVHVLPFLGYEKLYEQFRLDEPWDSQHNKTLISQMPEFYRCPSSPSNDYKTPYLVPHGKGFIMEGDAEVKLGTFRDGLSNTIAIVEVKDSFAVTWTQPEDLEWDSKKPNLDQLSKKLGSFHPGIFNVALTDGSVHTLSQNVEGKILKALMTRNGGENVPFSSIAR